jgi:hypothetical protein
MLSLQFGKLPAFCGMVGQLIVRENGPRDMSDRHAEGKRVQRVGGGAHAIRDFENFMAPTALPTSRTG